MTLPEPAKLRKASEVNRAAVARKRYDSERAMRQIIEARYQSFRDEHYELLLAEAQRKTALAATNGEFKARVHYFTYGFEDETDKRWSRLYREVSDEFQKSGYRTALSSGTDVGTGSDPGPPIFSIDLTISWENG